MSLDKNRHGSDTPLLCHRGTSLNALRIDLKKKKKDSKGNEHEMTVILTTQGQVKGTRKPKGREGRCGCRGQGGAGQLRFMFMHNSAFLVPF